MVLDVDPDKRRVSLGLKQCLDNPWAAFAQTYPAGSVIEGEVKNTTEFGVFVGLPGDIDGMVHLSDLSWDAPGEQALAGYKKGNAVRVKVIDVDVEKERISLGIKQLANDPFVSAADTIAKGATVTAVVAKVLESGLEVTVSNGAIGFIRKNDLSRERSEQRPDRFAIGDKIDAKVTNIDKATRKIALSIKALEIDEEKRAMAAYGSADSGATLGDILAPAIGAQRGKDAPKDAKD